MNMRLLIVEDDELQQRAVALALSRSFPNDEIVTATTIHDAINFINDCGIDVMIIDLSLPDSTPEKTLAMIRCNTDIPAIVYSSSTDEAIASLAADSGAVAFINKQCSMLTLTSQVAFARTKRMRWINLDTVFETSVARCDKVLCNLGVS